MYYCDSFRFFALFTVYFFGKGSLCRVLRQLRREVSLILLLSWPYWEQPNIYKPVLIAGIGRETTA